MSKENSKPILKPAPAGAKAAPAGAGKASAPEAPEPKKTGRVQFDERGNAVWEWSIATGAFGREVSTERLQKLENPGLSLAAVKGYNPYDSGKLSKAEQARKKDLKKLSEWLALKKQATGNNGDE